MSIRKKILQPSEIAISYFAKMYEQIGDSQAVAYPNHLISEYAKKGVVARVKISETDPHLPMLLKLESMGFLSHTMTIDKPLYYFRLSDKALIEITG